MLSQLIQNVSPPRDTPWWIYCLAVGPALAFVLSMTLQSFVPPWQLFLDPAKVALKAWPECCHVYYGFVSNIGAFLWCATAAITAFASLILFSRGGEGRRLYYLFFTSLFSGLLLFDDFFMLHDKLAPNRNVEQEIVLLVYFVLTIIYLFAFWGIFSKHDTLLFGLCLLAFSLSIIVDMTQERVVVDYFSGNLETRALEVAFLVGEDGTKFVGISTWATYHIRTAWRIVCNSPNSRICHT